MKSVLVAFSNPLMSRSVSASLAQCGYHIEASCRSAEELLRVSVSCHSRVVVNGFSFPDMNLENLHKRLNGRLAMITVLFPHQLSMVRTREMTVLPYPPSREDLSRAVERVGIYVSARGKALPHVRTADEILLIHQAKEIIIDTLGATEDQAHRFLQRLSMNHGLRLADAAQMLIRNPKTVSDLPPE